MEEKKMLVLNLQGTARGKPPHHEWRQRARDTVDGHGPECKLLHPVRALVNSKYSQMRPSFASGI